MLKDSKEIYPRCNPGTFINTWWIRLPNHKQIEKPNLILDQTGIAGTERENTHVIKSRGLALSLIGFKKNGRDIFSRNLVAQERMPSLSYIHVFFRTVISPLPGCWLWKPRLRTSHHRKRKCTRTSVCFWAPCRPRAFPWLCYRIALKSRMNRPRGSGLMQRERLENSAQIPLRTTVRWSYLINIPFCVHCLIHK